MTDEPEGRDPFVEALRGLPVRAISSDAQARHLHMIAALADEQPGRRRRRRRRFAIGAGSLVVALGLGAGTAAAFGAFRTEAPPDRSMAHCYSTLDLHSTVNHNDFMVANPGSSPSLPETASHAMDICEGAWMQGRLSLSDPKVLFDPQPGTFPVPPLIPCVLPSGQVGVFPGTAAACASLGLPVAELQGS